MPEFPKPFFKEPSAAEILKADSIRIITGPSLVQKIKDIEKEIKNKTQEITGLTQSKQEVSYIG